MSRINEYIIRKTVNFFFIDIFNFTKSTYVELLFRKNLINIFSSYLLIFLITFDITLFPLSKMVIFTFRRIKK